MIHIIHLVILSVWPIDGRVSFKEEVRSDHRSSLKMHVNARCKLTDLELLTCDFITEDGFYTRSKLMPATGPILKMCFFLCFPFFV